MIFFDSLTCVCVAEDIQNIQILKVLSVLHAL